MKSVALIVNGGGPEFLTPLLAEALENRGLIVTPMDLAKIHERDKKFFISAKHGDAEIDPATHSIVVRSIMGGIPGDTEKSLRLQEHLEAHGVRAQVPSAAVRRIADKIECGRSLKESGITLVPSVYVKPGESLPTKDIEALGPPWVVKKSIGSGKDSAVIAHTMDELQTAVSQYAGASTSRGAVIQKFAPNMTRDIADYLGVEPEGRSYQFRVAIINGKPFGASILYSKPREFSSNPEQGALSKPIPLEKLPEGVAHIALKAVRSFGRRTPRVAAVDVVLDAQARPCVLDMNVSPNPRFENAHGTSLMEGIADDARSMIERGKGKAQR